MVEVFKTNVLEMHKAKEIIQLLAEHFPECKINFDLKDCDKILRVEGVNVIPERVIALVNSGNYQCQALE
jgi:hypothetical protein